MIETVVDNVLEGNHDFSVWVDNISPDGAVTASGEFTVTITDAADGEFLMIGVDFYSDGLWHCNMYGQNYITFVIYSGYLGV